MRKIAFHLAVAALFLHGAVSAADQTPLISQMEESAATCRFMSMDGELDIALAKQSYGDKNPSYQRVVERVNKKLSDCVSRHMGKARAYVEDGIAAHPDLRPVLIDAHKAFLAYMDWMAAPRDITPDPVEDAYTAAMDRLKAALARK